MNINIIAAISKNGVIGSRKTNDLPWSKNAYPEDMAHFRNTTSGNDRVVIMGSSTMKSIGRKLPKRRNIVISRTCNLYNCEKTGIETYSSINEAISHCNNNESIWVIGGGLIYQQAISIASKLYITIIPEILTSDDLTNFVYFPFVNSQDFHITKTIILNASKDLFCYVYERISPHY